MTDDGRRMLKNINNEKIVGFLTNINFSQIFSYLVHHVVGGNRVVKIKPQLIVNKTMRDIKGVRLWTQADLWRGLS